MVLLLFLVFPSGPGVLITGFPRTGNLARGRRDLVAPRGGRRRALHGQRHPRARPAKRRSDSDGRPPPHPAHPQGRDRRHRRARGLRDHGSRRDPPPRRQPAPLAARPFAAGDGRGQRDLPKLFPAHSPPTDWNDRQHFFAVAAEAIRCILADHARKRGRLKRKAPGERVLLDDLLAAYDDKKIDVIAVHEALKELEQMDKRMVRIVDLRVFGGYLNREIAELLDISLRTVEREWSIARAWLRDRIEGDVGEAPNGGATPADARRGPVA
jgi:RNA polymerase sigma factor (sigma-70 family)